MRLPLIVAAWLIASAAICYFAAGYDATPGRAAAAPDEWPAGSGLRRAADRPTLLMFLHPRCPCSGASIDELAILLSRHTDQVAVTAVLQDSGNVAASTLWRSAAALTEV